MRKMRHNFLVPIAIVALLFGPSLSRAQDAGSEFSMHVGNLLPNQIEGVSEILPVFGARYAIGVGGGYAEVGVSNTHAEGVDFSVVEASIRGDFEVAPDVMGLAYFGPDFTWYRPVNESSRKGETGVHLGLGALMKVTDTLWLRSDLKFTGGPGTSLYLGFGITFRDSNGR